VGKKKKEIKLSTFKQEKSSEAPELLFVKAEISSLRYEL
jgi:hypothetical protein